MRGTSLQRIGPAALVLGLLVAGCGDDDRSTPTGTRLSRSAISNVQIQALSGQLARRNMQYQITATVTNPQGLVGGTAQLKPATVEARRGLALEAKTPIMQQNVVENVLRVVLVLVQPPVGTLQFIFSVIDAQGLESNGVPLVIRILAPPTSPASESPSTFVQVLGATFQHPRCMNCHGFQVPNQTGTDHIGRPSTCDTCHTVPGWHAPNATFNLAGLSKNQICHLVKSKQGNNAAVIETHLKDDPLIQWAISDGTVPSGPPALEKAPPGNLAAWNQRIDRWIDDGLVCN
jgi:hypothetical protein